MNSFWRQTLEIARMDLAVERQSGDIARLTVPFAAAALVVLPLALGLNLRLVEQVGVPFYWVVGLLFGSQLALRATATDTTARRDLHMLLGLDPVARMIGRWMAGSALMIIFLTILLALTVVLYNPTLPPGGLLALLAATLLFAPGVTMLSTLAGEVASGLRNRTSLASFLTIPMALPLLIGVSQWIEALGRDTGILPWVLLLLATNLGLLVLAVATAESLEEASR